MTCWLKCIQWTMKNIQGQKIVCNELWDGMCGISLVPTWMHTTKPYNNSSSNNMHSMVSIVTIKKISLTPLSVTSFFALNDVSSQVWLNSFIYWFHFWASSKNTFQFAECISILMFQVLSPRICRRLFQLIAYETKKITLCHTI